jgi:hypothetical protein
VYNDPKDCPGEEVDPIREADRTIIVVSVIVAVVSWLSLVFLVMNLPPAGLNVPLFFLALFLAVLCTITPVMWSVNRRLTSDSSSSVVAWRSLRQAGVFASFASISAWLQMMRSLNWITALLVFSVLLAMEILLELRR